MVRIKIQLESNNSQLFAIIKQFWRMFFIIEELKIECNECQRLLK